MAPLEAGLTRKVYKKFLFVASYFLRYSIPKKMPGRRFRRNRKGGKRRGRGRVGRPRANPRNVAEWASLSTKLTIVEGPGVDFSCNKMYNLRGVLKLSGYTRAEEVAKAYQFYRIASVRVTYVTPFDTFLQNNNQGRPNFYAMIDKAEAIPTLATLETLKGMGARPRGMDEKPISITWKPAVLQAAETLAGSAPSSYVLSPWISTAHPDIQHQGLFWYIEQKLFGGAGANLYYAEIELQFEFKKPLLYPVSGTTPAVSAVAAVRDGSSNGIVDNIA